MSKCSLVPSVLFAVFTIFSANALKADWDYTLQRIEWNSTDESIAAANLRPIRVSPGVYHLNGTLTFGADIDDKYTVEVKVYYSSKGSSRYLLTPFKVPKCSGYDFMNKVFKKHIMEDAHRCAGFPLFDKWNQPLRKGEIYLNSCILSTESLPTSGQIGFYKVVMEMNGPLVHFFIAIYIRTFSKDSNM